MIYWELLIGFLKVGCFAFGGAYGAIPLIREIVLSYGWLSEDTLTYMIAISESTPGPIMVNMATYIGSSQAGLLGALIATTAVVLPAFLIILLVSLLMGAVLQNKLVQTVLRGVTPCIIGIIFATGLSMIVGNCFPSGRPDGNALLITSVLAVILFGAKYIFKKKVSPITLIFLAACIGIVVYGI
ncbi:MAG: chromate transporter [Oscillospiraceae bacterium]|nr:chromate transporter [Oscillospiraceae bacterium]